MANDPYGGNYNYARDIFNMNKQQQALGQQGISPQAIDAILGANARADQERIAQNEQIGIAKERNRLAEEARKAEEERLRDQQRWANYMGIGQAIGNTALLGPMAYQGWKSILGGGKPAVDATGYTYSGAGGINTGVPTTLGGEAGVGDVAIGYNTGVPSSYGAYPTAEGFAPATVESYAPTVMVDGTSAAIPAGQATATGAGAGEGAAAAPSMAGPQAAIALALIGGHYYLRGRNTSYQDVLTRKVPAYLQDFSNRPFQAPREWAKSHWDNTVDSYSPRNIESKAGSAVNTAKNWFKKIL
jgi:hypothetical protein